ncbi:hypothetical protein O181_003120 [Austropuccinia psidii MF-1]|uniref:Uncharacterized protein n=1 Tax=Austropuccinia psidii MF-1 TaxID=1389203 RepID=A0A9Q3GDJ7_9BASI|nr:hypothetical protein [Austropuccinia psidii MF-1]
MRAEHSSLDSFDLSPSSLYSHVLSSTLPRATRSQKMLSQYLLHKDILLRATLILGLLPWVLAIQFSTIPKPSLMGYEQAGAYLWAKPPSQPVNPTNPLPDTITPPKPAQFNWDSISKKENVTCSLSYGAFDYKYDDSVCGFYCFVCFPERFSLS